MKFSYELKFTTEEEGFKLSLRALVSTTKNRFLISHIFCTNKKSSIIFPTHSTIFNFLLFMILILIMTCLIYFNFLNHNLNNSEHFIIVSKLSCCILIVSSFAISCRRRRRNLTNFRKFRKYSSKLCWKFCEELMSRWVTHEHYRLKFTVCS